MSTQRTRTLRDEIRADERPLDAELFWELIREGQELRRAFERQTARMRVITSEDMKSRCR